jgi:hypothetical protein
VTLDTPIVFEAFVVLVPLLLEFYAKAVLALLTHLLHELDAFNASRQPVNRQRVGATKEQKAMMSSARVMKGEGMPITWRVEMTEGVVGGGGRACTG